MSTTSGRTDVTYDELQGFSFSESEADSADYEAVVPVVTSPPQYRPRLRREPPPREPPRAAHAAPDDAAATASLLVAIQRTNQLLTALLQAARLNASELGALSAQLAEQRPHMRRAPR